MFKIQIFLFDQNLVYKAKVFRFGVVIDRGFESVVVQGFYIETKEHGNQNWLKKFESMA